MVNGIIQSSQLARKWPHYYFTNPKYNFDQEYLEYDTERQLELESYGYSFLRINKFSLLPYGEFRTNIEVLNHLLEKSLSV